jgi:hypothetical protein
MDAKTYKEITGLCNYEGFKSMLKTSRLFSSYGCSNETITLNCVKNISNTTLLLNANQVAVLLNLACNGYVSEETGIGAVTMVWKYDGIIATDISDNLRSYLGDQAVVGSLLAKTINPTTGTMQIAIFDLY